MTLRRWLFRAVTVATDGGQVTDEPNLNSQVAKQFERNEKEKGMKVKQRKWMFASGHHSERSWEKRDLFQRTGGRWKPSVDSRLLDAGPGSRLKRSLPTWFYLRLLGGWGG